MIQADNFIRVVRETLRQFEAQGGAAYSEQAVKLLVMIASHESDRGTYLWQVGGPALGPYQEEPKTCKDVYENFIRKDKALDFAVSKFLPNRKGLPDGDLTYLLITDLRFSTIMARCFFMRFKQPIPDTEIELAQYAKKYWNTELGKASVADYVHAYRRTVAGLKEEKL